MPTFSRNAVIFQCFSTKKLQQKALIHSCTTLIQWHLNFMEMIGFNSMSICVGILYAYRLENHIYCMFIFAFFFSVVASSSSNCTDSMEFLESLSPYIPLLLAASCVHTELLFFKVLLLGFFLDSVQHSCVFPIKPFFCVFY